MRVSGIGVGVGSGRWGTDRPDWAESRTTVDLLGHTAADVSLSVNDSISYILIRNEGLRSGSSGVFFASQRCLPPSKTQRASPNPS
jgi:hypothetical protein